MKFDKSELFVFDINYQVNSIDFEFDKLTIKKFSFTKLCEFKDLYEGTIPNNKINIDISGIYIFIDKGEILYIGSAIDSNDTIKNKILGHIDSDMKIKKEIFQVSLSDADCKDIEESIIYVYPIDNSPRKVKCLEAMLIDACHPKFNM